MGKVNIVPSHLMTNSGIKDDEVCYAMKLSNTSKRKSDENSHSGLGGLVSGITNAINDTVLSGHTELYFIKTKADRLWLLSDKIRPVHFAVVSVGKKIVYEPGALKITFDLPFGSMESVTLKMTKENMNSVFWGDFKMMLADVGEVRAENFSDYFVTTVISRHVTGEKASKYQKIFTSDSLVLCGNDGFTLVNCNKQYAYNRILAYHSVKGYCQFVVLEEGSFTLVELFENADGEVSDPGFNFIRSYGENEKNTMEFKFGGKGICASEFLTAFNVKDLSLMAVDDKLYHLGKNGVLECGVFRVYNDIYVRTIDGSTNIYRGCESVTETLSLLPSGYDSLFMNKEVSHPFMFEGKITDFRVDDNGIHSEKCSFKYADMKECKFESNDFSCRINFVYNGKKIGMTTANSLGIYVCTQQEKTYVRSQTSTYTINQLYDCFYKRCAKNFLASTFAEIFKTEKLLNVDMTLDEIIASIRADDSEVLRNAFQSMIGNFKNVEDIQSDLLQKVSLLEIQRRKIQKMFDEWTLYYPHYMATVQVNWLKYVFGNDINKEILNSEYWKCVSHYKRILGSGNSYVQKNMAEIGICINHMSAALPDKVKRTDITTDLRINSNTTQNALSGGVDVLVGLTAGVEFANIITRGLTATNPLAISLSAKLMVDSYTKDVKLRKNVKAFGLQSLEWWKIFMNGVRVQIFELANGVNEYNAQCLKRDTELFKRLSDEDKVKVKEKLSTALKDKIIESIDDKFIEIMPQFNIRISSIVNEIEANTAFLNMTLEEFKNKIFV